MSNSNYTKLAIYAFIQKENGEFLVLKRAVHDSYPGLWEMPGGGLEFGEDLEEAALREVKEETALDVTIENLITYKSEVEGKFNNEQLIRISFLAKMKNEKQDIKLSDEHSEYKWIKNQEEIKISPFLIKTFESLNKNNHA